MPTEGLSRVRGVLEGGGVSVEGGDSTSLLVGRGYGRVEDGRVILSPVEALHLVYEGRLEVSGGGGGEVGFEELLSRFLSSDPDLWVKYLVYRDLRVRGYVVKDGAGFGCDFRVYRKGGYGREAARYLVFILPEGRSFKLGFLREVARRAQRAKKELLLAVVDRRGDIVYYRLNVIPSGFGVGGGLEV